MAYHRTSFLRMHMGLCGMSVVTPLATSSQDVFGRATSFSDVCDTKPSCNFRMRWSSCGRCWASQDFVSRRRLESSWQDLSCEDYTKGLAPIHEHALEPGHHSAIQRCFQLGFQPQPKQDVVHELKVIVQDAVRKACKGGNAGHTKRAGWANSSSHRSCFRSPGPVAIAHRGNLRNKIFPRPFQSLVDKLLQELLTCFGGVQFSSTTLCSHRPSAHGFGAFGGVSDASSAPLQATQGERAECTEHEAESACA
eukprot:g9329.t1